MNDKECCEYYYNTGKVPPLTLTTWVSIYNIITGAGYGEIC